jgi:hypothetical protein
VSHVNRLYAAIVAIHMILCLCWIIYAIDMLKYSTDACWDRVTWQYINYYAVLLLTMGPACTLALATALCILCLPCLLQSLYKTMRDKRQREDLTEKVVNGLAQRTFNPEQFKSQKECAICIEEFVDGQKVTPLSCDVKHYFHTECIK